MNSMLYLFLISCTEPVEEPTIGEAVNLLSYVNPFIATGGIGYSVGCLSPCFPSPFQWSNSHRIHGAIEYGGNAGYYRGGGYHYDDRTIEGFSHMHLHNWPYRLWSALCNASQSNE